MKIIRALIGIVLVLALAAGTWIVLFHSDWFKRSTAEEEERPVETDVPVKTTTITRATLRRYVDGYGTVIPAPPLDGKPAGGATLSSPTAGVVSSILCSPGQRVEAGAPLIQLDDRLAKAMEAQAAAALDSAKATLAKLNATPRPEQLEVAQLTVDKARASLDLAQKNYDRQKSLPPEVVSPKSLQQTELELSAAMVDLKTAEKQFALLKASPTPEERAEASAKVHEADRALAVAQTQRAMLRIQAPMPATVIRVNVNLGEAVDATKVLAEIAALDRLVLSVVVSATELRSLKVGMPAEIQIAEHSAASPATTPATQPAADASETASAKGAILLIGSGIDPKTDTVPVWIKIPQDAAMLPGQFARVRIVAEEHAQTLAVPDESVVTDPQGHTVVALLKGDKAIQTPVQVGLRDRGLVEIKSADLKEGDVVVTAGAYGLPKETKVHIIAP
jgi:RND family efflux transporter MFP subunit